MTTDPKYIIPDVPPDPSSVPDWLFTNFQAIAALFQSGATGAFTSADGKVVTVKHGLITNIEEV